MKRKPRLQLRLPDGLTPTIIRKALNLGLALDGGTMGLVVRDPRGPVLGPAPADPPPRPAPPPPDPAPDTASQERLAALRAEIDRLSAVVSVLSFDPLPQGVETKADALHVLGFPPNANPDSRELRARFRLLATIHHPDAANGSHARMSQLNAAMDLLRR